MTKAPSPFDSKDYTPEQARAQVAFEAQLAHTANLINTALTTHPHFTDDCGDYLESALDLSMRLQGARMNGVEDLLTEMLRLIPRERTDLDNDFDPFVFDYASDGVSEGIINWAIDNGAKEEDA